MNKVLLLILDGYGINEHEYGNAIAAANTQNLDYFRTQNPEGQLFASEEEVGLLNGDMGNSEVGHLNIGAGRVVYQMNSLIMNKINENTFFNNKELIENIAHAKKNNSKLHMFGLLSNGNVHSNINHIWAILKLAKMNGVKQVYFHAFMDGRDTLPNSGIGFIEEFQKKEKKLGLVRSLLSQEDIMLWTETTDGIESKKLIRQLFMVLVKNFLILKKQFKIVMMIR